MADTPEYLPEAPDEDLHAIESQYLTEEAEFLVGVVNDTVVGMGAYSTPEQWKENYVEIEEETAELTRMRVDPEWQGQGIGKALYHELRRRARSAGYQHFILDTGTENTSAREFYEKVGFECQREISIDYGDVTLELALYKASILDSSSDS